MGSLDDGYELGGVAGQGRTTVVRLAVRRGDCRSVALKQLRAEHAVHPDRRARFLVQARRASVLHHDSIEEVFDLVDHHDAPTIVSEWIDGRSLQRLATALRHQRRTWDPVAVAVITERLLEGLRYAHQQMGPFASHGMPHGGIWPGNVLVDVHGNVKLVDFGMAAIWQESVEPWQNLEAMRYLSAAHLRGGASEASDLYSVGALVHELLSSQRFRDEHDTEAEMRAAIDSNEGVPPLDADIPTPLERVRRRLLEPISDARVAMEQVLDLCATISVQDSRRRLGELVERALRDDSTAPTDLPPREPGAPQRGRKDRPTGPEATVEPRVDLGKRLARRFRSKKRGQDTGSVPVPVDHELTAERRPLYLKQTALPEGEEARDAEDRRSGGQLGTRPAAVDTSIADVDTAPLVIGENDDDDDLASDQQQRDDSIDPGETAEVERIPLLPDNEQATRATPTSRHRAAASRRSLSWLRGPLGYVLLGAVAVAIGMPLIARCGASPPSHSPSPPPRR
ncbi:MAG: protein kinase [Deltaproteobacteria bacterium]|nr:protein kinase [Deltaproteobacteria bacterium]